MALRPSARFQVGFKRPRRHRGGSGGTSPFLSSTCYILLSGSSADVNVTLQVAV